jgi:hypothetical protein
VSAPREILSAAEKRLRLRVQKYGLTVQQFWAMERMQGNVCALCCKPPKAGGRPLEIDHDHKTGRVRGLLCWFCNHKRVGRARSAGDAAIYLRLARYISSDFDARKL